MAKITSPLMSKTASGSIGKEMTFSERKSGSQVRYQKKQTSENKTPLQLNNQILYRIIYARWLSMSANEQDVYNDEVKSKNLQMSGWNLFFKKVFADKSLIKLIGLWEFNKVVGGKVLDQSGNGNDADLLPSYPLNSPVLENVDFKKLGKALNCDGIDDYISVPHNSIFVPADDMLTFIYIYYQLEEETIDAKGCGTKGSVGGSGAGYGFVRFNFADVGLYYAPKVKIGDPGFLYVIEDILLPNQWHMGVCVNDITNNRRRFYLDNILQIDDVGVGTFAGNTDPIYFMRELGYNKGKAGMCLIYNRALQTGELNSLYNMLMK